MIKCDSQAEQASSRAVSQAYQKQEDENVDADDKIVYEHLWPKDKVLDIMSQD